MNYKLINAETGEVHLCQKIVIDGFYYYVSDETPKHGNYIIYKNQLYIIQDGDNELFHLSKKVIATNNPNIDIPKVVDEVERLAENHFFVTEKQLLEIWKEQKTQTIYFK